MHWILQNNLYDEHAFKQLLVQLDRQDTTYDIVKVIPFSHELQGEVTDTDDNIFVCGATSLGNISKEKGWVPGYFDDNLNMEIVHSQYKDEMLNDEMIVSKFRDVNPPSSWKEFFVRPCSDKKEFAGYVTTRYEFSDWQQKVIDLEGNSSYTSLSSDDDVIIAPVKHINAEYRFFVVDGKVVTGSLYKQGSRVFYSDHVDACVTEYAQKMVDMWQPNRAFCLDVADVDSKYKVIEINAINSAGFYALNMGKFVNAINSMEF